MGSIIRSVEGAVLLVVRVNKVYGEEGTQSTQYTTTSSTSNAKCLTIYVVHQRCIFIEYSNSILLVNPPPSFAGLAGLPWACLSLLGLLADE